MLVMEAVLMCAYVPFYSVVDTCCIMFILFGILQDDLDVSFSFERKCSKKGTHHFMKMKKLVSLFQRRFPNICNMRKNL